MKIFILIFFIYFILNYLIIIISSFSSLNCFFLLQFLLFFLVNGRVHESVHRLTVFNINIFSLYFPYKIDLQYLIFSVVNSTYEQIFLCVILIIYAGVKELCKSKNVT